MEQQIKTIDALLNVGFCIAAIKHNIQTEKAEIIFEKKATEERIVYNFNLKNNNVEYLNKLKRTII